MSKSNPYSYLFTVSACPAPEQLHDYAAGSLDVGTTHEVETHLADCEFCSDALEGIALVGADVAAAKVAEINNELDVITGVKARKGKFAPIWVRRVAAAAVILVFIGGCVVLMQYLQNQQAAEEVFTKHFEKYPAPEETLSLIHI